MFLYTAHVQENGKSSCIIVSKTMSFDTSLFMLEDPGVLGLQNSSSFFFIKVKKIDIHS